MLSALDANPTDAGLIARLALLGAVLVVAIGTGAVLALVLRRGRRLRGEARKPANAADAPPPVSAWYEAGKRARPEPDNEPHDEDDDENHFDSSEPDPFTPDDQPPPSR